MDPDCFKWKCKTHEGFGDFVMCGDDEALTGLWFAGSRDDMRDARGCERRETPVFRDTCRWLDEYFKGQDPSFTPKYRIEGATPFRCWYTASTVPTERARCARCTAYCDRAGQSTTR